MIRSEAIRAYCKACYGDEHSASACELSECPLYRYRGSREDTSAPNARVTRGRAIALFCVECMGGQRIVRSCTAPACVLYRYRMGTNDAA